MNVDEQAQIQLPALSLKELIQPSAMTALDHPFIYLAVIMRLLSQSPAHSAGGRNGYAASFSAPARSVLFAPLLARAGSLPESRDRHQY